MNLLDSRGPRSCSACGAALEVVTADGELTIEGPSLPPLADGLSVIRDEPAKDSYREESTGRLILRWTAPRHVPDRWASRPMLAVLSFSVLAAWMFGPNVGAWVVGIGLVLLVGGVALLALTPTSHQLLLAEGEIHHTRERWRPVPRVAVKEVQDVRVSSSSTRPRVRAALLDGTEVDLATDLPSKAAALYVAARLRSGLQP